MIYVLGPRDRKKIAELKATMPVIMTTSSSVTDWSRGLSPFYLGPCKLYGDYEARRMENAWQASKVHKEFVGEDGNPTDRYFEWAWRIWKSDRAQRYPMGKGAVPEYSYWDGKKLGYVEARKKIYIPLYIRAVLMTDAFAKLQQEFIMNKDLILWDYDAYDHREMGMTYEQVMSNPDKKMGHAFVLAMMLEDKKLIKETYNERLTV